MNIDVNVGIEWAAGTVLEAAACAPFRRKPNTGEVAGADGKVGVRPGERVRVPILSGDRRRALAMFDKVLERIGPTRAQGFFVLQWEGEESVAIEAVSVGAYDLGNIRSTWLAGAIVDEKTPHLFEILRAIGPRLLPGCRVAVVDGA